MTKTCVNSAKSISVRLESDFSLVFSRAISLKLDQFESVAEMVNIQTLLILIFGFVGFSATTSHIWKDKSAVYALERDIFLLPGYRAPNTVVEQIMNRKLHDIPNEKEHNTKRL